MTLLVSMFVWMIWGTAMAGAGVRFNQPGFWGIWVATFLIALWYGSKHHWEKKE